MRKPPDKDIAIPKAQPRSDDNIITQVREYELITPLFGGGVEPGECDRLTPIRGTAIRGQLRFWWRATRGGQFEGKMSRMKEAEELIWGAAGSGEKVRPSQVQVVVSTVVGGHPMSYRALDRDLQYAAFPLQDGDKGVSSGIKFTLCISYPKKIECQDNNCKERALQDVAAEIEAALWAWETFGGIGARTRRGFGALRLTRKEGQPVLITPAPRTPREVQDLIKKGLSKHLTSSAWPDDVPHLTDDVFWYRATETKRTSLDAWKAVLAELKNFRQHRAVSQTRDPRSNKNVRVFERSRWPEADSIRRITGQWLKPGVKGSNHPGHVPSPASSNKFPRAAFGLPIVFHFKDADSRNPRNPDRDPRDVVLRLARYDRLASPLILRPLWLSDGRYAGIAVLLVGTLQPEDFDSDDIDLVLAEKTGSPTIARRLTAQLTAAEARSIKEVGSNKPLLGDETDPVIAFLNRFQKEVE